jgi:hypothetical protein
MNPMRILLTAFLLAGLGWGQQILAPGREPVGPAKGEDWHGYNISDSFENGYRFRLVGGNQDTYRSDVNYGDGYGLLSGHFRMNSKSGQGFWFDELLIDAQGLNGGDANRFTSLRIQKNRLYRYDAVFRQTEYFNPGLTSGDAGGLHELDTLFRLQDHDFTLLPQSKFRILAGFSTSLDTGPGISTAQLFDAHSDGLPLSVAIHQVRNEFRIGNEIQLFGMKLTWMRGWEYFKEDSPVSILTGAPPDAGASVTSFQRSEPYRGSSPYWRAGLFAGNKRVSANGRFTRTSGTGVFALNENATGLQFSGIGVRQQVLAAGNARRPVTTANLTFNVNLTKKLTATSSAGYYDAEMLGNATFLSLVNGSSQSAAINLQSLIIRTFSADTVVNYQFDRRLGIGLGYHYANRLVSSSEEADAGFYTDLESGRQTNQLHSGSLQLRSQLTSTLSASVDGELGRANHPIYPVSEGNYYTVGGRLQYRRKKLNLRVGSQQKYNNNSVLASPYSSLSRSEQTHGSYALRDWVTLDVDYSKTHLNTAGGLAYFLNGEFNTSDLSLYISNIHALNIGAQFTAGKRTNLYVGYSRVQDTGDGRSTADGAAGGSSSTPFQAAQTFPLVYQSPLARLSIKINPKLRWNFGYQYYGYGEQFYKTHSFRANTGYSSLSWSL